MQQFRHAPQRLRAGRAGRAWNLPIFPDPARYTAYDKVNTDGNGDAFYSWYADVTDGGQYIVWGRTDTAVGSAVFIVEAEDDCAYDAPCIQF